jgi:hypothetical protein
MLSVALLEHTKQRTQLIQDLGILIFMLKLYTSATPPHASEVPLAHMSIEWRPCGVSES